MNSKIKRNTRNVHERIDDIRSVEEIDEQRINDKVYTYLCYVQEAKNWVCSVTNIKLQSLEEFEEELRKGNILANLAMHYAPKSVGKVFVSDKLQYRHTDNLNYFINSLREIRLSPIFYFGVLDCYEKKNIPNVIFCLHALAHYLVKIGKGLKIECLWGQPIFTKKEYEKKEKELKDVPMPKFSEIKSVVSKETLGCLLAPIIKKRVYVSVQKMKKQKMRALLEAEADKINSVVEILSLRIKKKLEIVHTLRVQSYLKTFLYKKAFDEICYGNPGIFAIRKFLFVLKQNAETLQIESKIDEYHLKIKERMKKNYLIESYIDHLEISVGFLLNNKVNITKMSKNRPSIDEVLSIYPLETPEYKMFQEFFYTLQTKPKYISSLLIALPRTKAEEFINNYVITLFSCSKTQRDEYMIHKLIEQLFRVEIEKFDEVPLESLLTTILATNHLRQNYGKFSENYLGIIGMLKNNYVECDPFEIAKSLRKDVKNRTEALAITEVREKYSEGLKNWKIIIDSIISETEKLIPNLPFSIRYFIQILNSVPNLKLRIPEFFFNECIVPFILAPDVFVKESYIPKNLRNKCFTATQFISGLLKNEIPDYFYPIQDFMKACQERFKEIFKKILDIDDYFSENGQFRIHKPMVQFTGREANEILEIFREHIDSITNETDPFYQQILNASPLRYKNEQSITFFLNCAIEEERQNYGDLKSRVVNEIAEHKGDFYEIITNSKLKGEFEELNNKGIVSKEKRYSEFLSILAKDILKISSMRIQRIKELEINRKTLENTIKRSEYLENMRQNLESHFKAFMEQIIVKRPSGDSKYGKYSYKAQKLLQKGVILTIRDFNDEPMVIILSCNDPNTFNFEVMVDNVRIAQCEFKLDMLLRMKYRGKESLNVENLLELSVDGIINLINENYFLE